MAPLPKKFDARAHWIRDLLHQGNRDEALALLNDAVASGRAGAETRALAEYLATAKRGRQPFGAKYRWIEIGQDNDEWRSEGMSYEHRLNRLALKYRLNDPAKIKTAIRRYEVACEETRAIDEENRQQARPDFRQLNGSGVNAYKLPYTPN